MTNQYESDTLTLHDRICGLLLGTAIGDTLGLPAEGISRRRARKFFKGCWRHRFIFGKGMFSDDTEHTIFVAQALLAHPDSQTHFARRLAWSFRLWLLTLPAGIGLATLKSILRLWIGYNPAHSGVFSAGNGPAMRVAPIGAFYAYNEHTRAAYVSASTHITHTDPKALIATQAIANLTAWIIREKPTSEPPWAMLAPLLNGQLDPTWDALLSKIEYARTQNISVEEFAESLGLGNGVTGYIFHTVPIAIYAWLRHWGDFEKTLSSVLNCGGDTDTVGAITGALAGATVGESGIPAEWIAGVCDWPRNITLLRKLGNAMADAMHNQVPTQSIPYFWPGVIPRNIFFLLIVLLHGLRRLAPPY